MPPKAFPLECREPVGTRFPGPSISVVIPAYNLERYLPLALHSVLRQSSLPDEVIVVDDGSTDDTAEAARAAGACGPEGLVKVVSIPHAGPGAARNRGLREAHGQWISFLDGDDQWLPEKIARVREAIAARPEAGIITHDDYLVRADGKEEYRNLHARFDGRKPLLPQLYKRSSLATSCMTVRADALRNAGGFDPDLPACQDYDLWLKVARAHEAAFIPEPLTRYFVRAGNISSDVLRRHRCALRIAHRHAPSLVPVLGRSRAYLLRLRAVLTFHYVLSSSLLEAGRPGKLLGLVPGMIASLGQALARPLSSPAGRELA